MDYSDKILSDYNLDEEIEIVSGLLGPMNSSEFEVYKKLPDGFESQESIDENRNERGFTEYIKTGGSRPDISACINNGVCQVLISGEIAVKFKNAYLSLHFNEAI